MGISASRITWHFGLATIIMLYYGCAEPVREDIVIPSTTGFELINPEYSGVHFVNNITEDELNNIVDYDYMYNGAGVALGDLNNDGLLDIYFCGNMVSDRIYINKGDFKFEDITETLYCVTLFAHGVTKLAKEKIP